MHHDDMEPLELDSLADFTIQDLFRCFRQHRQ